VTVAILDDDGPGTIDFSDPSYSVVEGAGVATITVARASASNLVESVDYTTTELPAGSGHAAAGTDYTSTTGTLTFSTGEMSKTFQVPIVDDQSYEGDETLNITLSNPQNLTNPLQPPVLGPNTAPGPTTLTAPLTIVDDDVPTFTFSSATYSVAENAGIKTITVNRGGDTSIATSVDYATSDGTASAGTDYTATSGHLDFAAGQTTNSFTIPIIDDNTGGEPNRTVNLTLSANGSTVDTALLSIFDDEPGTPSVQFAAPTYSVGEADGNATLIITLSHAAAGDVTVHYSTADGTPPTDATAGADYTAVTNSVTFSAGQTSKSIVIPVANDSDPESDETFTVSLTSQTGAQFAEPRTAIVTIVDNDGAGSLDLSALRYDANEKDGHATITVRRTGGSVGATSVDYFTTDGSAHAPGDYADTHGTLTFGDGETSKTFDIPVAWDGLPEGDETVSIGLRNFDSDDDPDAVKAAVLHIADDGASGPVQFSAASYSVSETAGNATITVNRSGGSLGGPVTVYYAGTDGTHGTLTFGAGETSKAFEVPVVDDNVHTGTRTVNLALSNPGGGTSLGSQATAALNITDDEPASSPSTDKAAPKLTITAKKLQKALTGKRIVLKVRSNEAAKLSVAANLRKGKKLVRLAKASKRVGAGKTVTITIKVNKKALSALAKALVKGKVKVTLAVKGTDAAKNSATVSKTITLK
jgi:Calx-beta domain